jgi:hypothetical protein
MQYGNRLDANVIMFASSLVKIGQLVQRLKGDTHGHIVNLLLSLRKASSTEDNTSHKTPFCLW